MENKNLFTAFVKFQSELKGLVPNSTNPFFKSTYITLDGILETVRPLLAKHGLAVIQEATGDGESIFVKTRLIHESGEMLETDLLKMKPQKNDPQSQGSCITYSKRYQLAALLGICENVDDDGNKATYGQNTPTKTSSSKGNNISTRSKTLSEEQIKALYKVSEAAGYNAARLVALVKAKYKCDPEYLTKAEFDHVYGSLNKK